MEDENQEKLIKTENFWKCKGCGEIVEIDFDACWNCLATKPHEIVHPSVDELLKYQSDDEELLEAENYWKCPKCGQTVEMDFTVCWNCENVVVEEFERPTVDEMLNYQSTEKKPVSIIKSGFLTIGAGLIVLAFSGLVSLSGNLEFERIYYGRFLFGIFFIIVGIFLIIVGYSQKIKP